MSFPASLTTRIVKGRFVTYPDGVAAKGSVRIVLAEAMQGPTDDVFVVPFDSIRPLDSNGAFSVVLPANDDPQWTPSYYRITITIEIVPQTYRTKGVYKVLNFKLVVPYNETTPIDLADVVNLPAPTQGESYIVLASKGAPGGVATLGSDGKITPSQLPTGSGGVVSWDDLEDKPSTFPHAAISFSELTDKPATYPHDEVTWSQVSGKPSTFPFVPPSFAEVTAKPSTYPPSAHTHAFTDVTDKPSVYPHAPITWDEITGKPDTFPGAGDGGSTSLAWADITGKPSVFPANPTDWTAIPNKPSVFPAAPVAFSDITSKPASYPSTWTDVSGKPVTFTPAAHIHATSDVTGLDTALTAKANTSDVSTALAGKANTSHTHAQSDISGLSTALAAKADSSAVTSALSTKADLVGGVLATSQIPAITVTDLLGTVATQTAMLALVGQKGDWALRSDLGQAWVITGTDPTQLSSWTPMPLGTSPVQTVNGQTGTVVLGKTDIGLGSVDNTADSAKPVSTAQQNALNLKANLASPTFTGTVSGVTAAMVGLGNVTNTSDANKPVSTAQATAIGLKADLASPTLTGVPLAPTATAGANTTQIATTAFVTAADALRQPLATLTTKGDLYVATAASTVTRLPVGADTQVLIADSTKAAGVKWGDAPSGGGGGTAATFARAYVTSGDIVPGAAAAFTPITGLSIALAAVAGDDVEVTLSGLFNQTASDFFELVVLVAGAIVRYGSTGTSSPTAAGEGDPSMYPASSSAIIRTTANYSLAVASGDLSGGNVTFGLAFKGSGSGKVFASTNYPLRWRVRNDH